jgi:perosamine synthetase
MSQMKVPQFRSFVDMEDYENIRQVFERNYIAEGPMGLQFRDKLNEVVGAKYGVLASNGTLAIYLALKALGIGAGDEVYSVGKCDRNGRCKAGVRRYPSL